MAYDPVLAQIGNKIVKRRDELNMSAAELAVQADISANTLSLYESGQRTMGVDKMHRIAKALKVPFSYLQPDDLSIYSLVPGDCFAVLEMLKDLPKEKRHTMIKMFQAQIATLM